MPFDPLVALALPREALVDRRVPKKLLVQKGASSVRDRLRIQRGIHELRWLAAVKPSTVGIAEYRDTEREYLEIAVLGLQLHPTARSMHLVKLVHRSIPYPVLLIVRRNDTLELSLAHKRRSLSDPDKTVIDGGIVTAQVSGDCPHHLSAALRKALALACQPHGTLKDLYRGWIETVHAFLAARITGAFCLSPTATAASAREAALHEYSALSNKIATVYSAARKEKQLALRAELNLELTRLRATRDAAQARL